MAVPSTVNADTRTRLKWSIFNALLAGDFFKIIDCFPLLQGGNIRPHSRFVQCSTVNRGLFSTRLIGPCYRDIHAIITSVIDILFRHCWLWQAYWKLRWRIWSSPSQFTDFQRGSERRFVCICFPLLTLRCPVFVSLLFEHFIKQKNTDGLFVRFFIDIRVICTVDVGTECSVFCHRSIGICLC